MTDKNPETRIQSFRQIETLLGGQRSDIDFSDNDKDKYTKFINQLISVISNTNNDTIYESNAEMVSEKLEGIYRNNVLNNAIYNSQICSVISCFISDYQYFKNSTLDVQALKDFLEMFTSKPKEYKNLILLSLQSRLRGIRTLSPSIDGEVSF